MPLGELSDHTHPTVWRFTASKFANKIGVLMINDRLIELFILTLEEIQQSENLSSDATVLSQVKSSLVQAIAELSVMRDD